jgi:hypothetical protein
MTGPGRGSRAADALAVVTLATLCSALFSVHLFRRGIFVGDSDRLNTFLNMRKFEIESLQNGGLHTWNEYTFMGLSTYGVWLPDPLVFLQALLPVTTLFESTTVVACGLLIGAAGATYAFIKDCCHDVFAALVGTSLAVFSVLSVLRIAQASICSFSPSSSTSPTC